MVTMAVHFDRARDFQLFRSGVRGREIKKAEGECFGFWKVENGAGGGAFRGMFFTLQKNDEQAKPYWRESFARLKLHLYWCVAVQF